MKYLILVLMIGLASCSKSKNSSDNPASNESGGKKIDKTLGTHIPVKLEDGDFESTLHEEKGILKIEPITYQGLPVVSGPQILCRLAGYQVALNFEIQEFPLSTAYIYIKGGGLFGHTFFKREGKQISALKSVTCSKKIQ